MPEKKPKKRMGCLIVLIIAALFVCVIAVGISTSQKSAPSAQNKTLAKSQLAKTMELTEQQEEAMLEVFTACGIGEVKDVTQFQTGDVHTSYHVNDEETARYKGVDNTIIVWVDNSSKTVESIYFHDHDIYMDGEVVAQVSSYYVPYALSEEYRVEAQLLVEKLLNYPKSAKFGSRSKWAFGVNEDGYDVVQSSVDAKNAYGMESNEKFQVIFDRKTKTAVSLILGDTEYIKK